MVRFEENKLVIEIPCHEGEVADYYIGLQNALYGVYWLATAKHNEAEVVSNKLNWIATYLGPALAELEPAAKLALNHLHLKKADIDLSADNVSDTQLLALLNDLEASRFQSILQQLNDTK